MNWETMIPKDEERILCAAIWYKDAKSTPHQPNNIDRGVVISGWRHGSIIASVKGMFSLNTFKFGANSVTKNTNYLL